MSLTRRSSRFVHVQIPGSTGRERVIRNDNETLIGRRLDVQASKWMKHFRSYLRLSRFLDNDFSIVRDSFDHDIGPLERKFNVELRRTL